MRRRGRYRRVTVVLVLALAGATVTACGGGSASSGTLRTSALFSDVSDLAIGAPVQMADITVGSVSSITLSGIDADVTMSIQRAARVPADVTASVETTTILGERIIQLTPGSGLTASSPLLADGARISHTVVVPDLEQLVKGGAQLFAPISASALASLVQAGGQGFGDQGADVHRLIDDLSAVSAGYATQTSTIQGLINALNQLGASTAPDAQANADAVTNLARTTQILAEESSRFEDLLTALNGLSVQSRSILEGYLSQIGIQLTGLADATRAVATEQVDLANVLVYLKSHNKAISEAAVGRFVQILDDIIVCGVPNGGDTPSSASAACTPTAQSTGP
ncbi:MAG TPA: MCE family protein [Acidimicrobiales bacterium]|nr:MCE family protein [Acidimicrobiales bacterium]